MIILFGVRVCLFAIISVFYAHLRNIQRQKPDTRRRATKRRTSSRHTVALEKIQILNHCSSSTFFLCFLEGGMHDCGGYAHDWFFVHKPPTGAHLTARWFSPTHTTPGTVRSNLFNDRQVARLIFTHLATRATVSPLSPFFSQPIFRYRAHGVRRRRLCLLSNTSRPFLLRTAGTRLRKTKRQFHWADLWTFPPRSFALTGRVMRDARARHGFGTFYRFTGSKKNTRRHEAKRVVSINENW